MQGYFRTTCCDRRPMLGQLEDIFSKHMACAGVPVPSTRRCCSEVILCVSEHNGGVGATDRAEQPLAQFRRAFPRTRSSSEGDRRAYCLIAFRCEQCQLPPKRMASNSDPAGIDSWHCLQKS